MERAIDGISIRIDELSAELVSKVFKASVNVCILFEICRSFPLPYSFIKLHELHLAFSRYSQKQKAELGIGFP